MTALIFVPEFETPAIRQYYGRPSADPEIDERDTLVEWTPEEFEVFVATDDLDDLPAALQEKLGYEPRSLPA